MKPLIIFVIDLGHPAVKRGIAYDLHIHATWALVIEQVDIVLINEGRRAEGERNSRREAAVVDILVVWEDSFDVHNFCNHRDIQAGPKNTWGVLLLVFRQWGNDVHDQEQQV